jgi:hypothetical protein
MTFKIEPNPQFAADIKITRLGETDPGVITFTFCHQGRVALKTWIDQVVEQGDAPLLAQVIAGWNGVVDGDGQAVAFSAEALAQLLDAFPAAGEEIFLGYLKALRESRAKN